MNTLVLTVIGQDRAGLVHALAEVVSRGGGNWGNSRMAHLAGTFAGIVEVEVPVDRADALVESLRSLDDRLEVVVRRSTEPQPAPTRVPFSLDLVGDDHPGIVEEITGVLARAGVNVDDLTTSSSDAPMSGGRIFTARVRLDAPEGTDLAVLATELEDLARDLMVDLTLGGSENE